MKRGILKVKVRGGKLAGFGNACPYNKIGYCTDETDTYWGEALAVVQADGSGDVVLEVCEKEGEKLGSEVIVPLEK